MAQIIYPEENVCVLITDDGAYYASGGIKEGEGVVAHYRPHGACFMTYDSASSIHDLLLKNGRVTEIKKLQLKIM
jgi:hypothetical protein